MRNRFAITGIEQAIVAAGGQAALARLLGVSQQSVCEWKARGYPPYRRITEIANETGVDPKDLINPKVAEAIAPPFGMPRAVDTSDLM